MPSYLDPYAHRPVTPGDPTPQPPGDPSPSPQPTPVPPSSPPPVRASYWGNAAQVIEGYPRAQAWR